MSMTEDNSLLIHLRKLTESDFLIWIDELLGLRGWGLILYGVLPSNLAVFSLDAKLPDLNKFPINFIILASITPLFFIFAMITNQVRRWYITKDRFGVRSLSITFLIMLISGLIIEISGVLNNKFLLNAPRNNDIFLASEEFFLVFSGLVLSTSSLFFISLMYKNDFPFLPSPSFEKSMDIIEGNLRKILHERIWVEYSDIDDSLIELVTATIEEIDRVIWSNGNRFAKLSLKYYCKDLRNLKKILEKIKENRSEGSKKYDWIIYFDIYGNLTNDQYLRRVDGKEAFDSLYRLRNIELGE